MLARVNAVGLWVAVSSQCKGVSAVRLRTSGSHSIGSSPVSGARGLSVGPSSVLSLFAGGSSMEGGA